MAATPVFCLALSALLSLAYGYIYDCTTATYGDVSGVAVVMPTANLLPIWPRWDLAIDDPINVLTAGAQAFPMDVIGRLGHDPPRGPSANWYPQCVPGAGVVAEDWDLLQLFLAPDFQLIVHPQADCPRTDPPGEDIPEH
ncbi:hypothetical protein evm_012433 [Chilo suppressalis]|nr:hypothetical protein evm_012433 [Chilo suppressalis]